MTTETPESNSAQTNDPSMQQQANGRCRNDYKGYRRCGGGRKAFMVLALIGSFFAGGVALGHLHAENMPPIAAGWIHGDHEGEGMFHHRRGPMSPEQRVEFGRYALDRALTKVDATADQKTKILAIFDETAKSVSGMDVKAFAARQEVVALLTAPTVDKTKLEALRSAKIGDIDTTSKTVVDAIAKVSEILSADQRVKLAMLVEQFHHEGPHR